MSNGDSTRDFVFFLFLGSKLWMQNDYRNSKIITDGSFDYSKRIQAMMRKNKYVNRWLYGDYTRRLVCFLGSKS